MSTTTWFGATPPSRRQRRTRTAYQRGLAVADHRVGLGVGLVLLVVLAIVNYLFPASI
jgi:hypothetical protein